MTSLRLTLGAIALMLIGLLAPTPPASAQEPREADFSEFYEALEPHGRWLTHPDHGYVWSPHVAADDEDWRPYTRGHWVPTEEHGWYWVSDEPFGWAVYHYGRWRLDERDGWIWIPGSEWAPAWVAWRDSDEHVGWAPLPPEARWDGVTLSYRSDFADAPWYAPYWVFVSPGYIGQPGLYRHVVPHARNAYYLRRSRFATDYRAIDRRIFNRGIDPRVLESRTARPIPFVRITPGHSHREHGMQRGDRSVLQVYRPQFRPAPAIPVVPRITPPQESRQARTREGGDFGLRRWSGERRGDYGARGANAPGQEPRFRAPPRLRGHRRSNRQPCCRPTHARQSCPRHPMMLRPSAIQRPCEHSQTALRAGRWSRRWP